MENGKGKVDTRYNHIDELITNIRGGKLRGASLKQTINSAIDETLKAFEDYKKIIPSRNFMFLEGFSNKEEVLIFFIFEMLRKLDRETVLNLYREELLAMLTSVNLQNIMSMSVAGLEDLLGYSSMAEIDSITRDFDAQQVYEMSASETAALERDYAEKLGKSMPRKDYGSRLRSVALNDKDNILIIGESGTSKELMATALWLMSNQRNSDMVTVNCAAIPENLLESVLFGHERGAFTNAFKKQEGLVKEANGGILFLDEIGKMPTYVQSKLLRAIETKKYRPLGGKEVRSDFRVFATVQPSELKEFKVIRDLLARLNTSSAIEMPTLKERLAANVRIPVNTVMNRLKSEDTRSPHSIYLRFEILETYDYLPEQCYSTLKAYDWPGNYRELENVLSYALRMASLRESKIIHEEDIREAIANSERIFKGEIKEEQYVANQSPDYGLSLNQYQDALEKDRKRKVCEWFNFNLSGNKKMKDLASGGSNAEYQALRRAYQEAFGKKWRERKKSA